MSSPSLPPSPPLPQLTGPTVATIDSFDDDGVSELAWTAPADVDTNGMHFSSFSFPPSCLVLPPFSCVSFPPTSVFVSAVACTRALLRFVPIVFTTPQIDSWTHLPPFFPPSLPTPTAATGKYYLQAFPADFPALFAFSQVFSFKDSATADKPNPWMIDLKSL